MYSGLAIEARRCHATKRDGTPCRAWGVWPDVYCVRHGGFSNIPPRRTAYGGYRSRAPACHCPAYAWPHRPGGGLCNWPSEVPSGEHPTPAGTHDWPRMRSQPYMEYARILKFSRLRELRAAALERQRLASAPGVPQQPPSKALADAIRFLIAGRPDDSVPRKE